MPPPAPDGRYGERGGIVIRSHVHETPVAIDIVDAVGIRAGNVGAREVVPLNLDRLLLRQPLPSSVRIVSDQFLLLGVHRDDGRPLCQGPLDLRVDVAELRVAVGMVVPLFHLTVALQAVPLHVQELGDFHVTDRMPLTGELRGEGPRALAGPAQRRLRIARVSGSIRRSSAPAKRGSWSVIFFLPAPGCRTRPWESTVPDSISL